MPRNRPDQEIVDPQRHLHDLVEILRRRPAEGGDVLLRHHRVAELVVLVVVLDDRARQRRAFGDAEALGERAGRDVAHHHLERDDLDLAHQLLAHVEAAHEMRRDADLGELHHQEFADAVVEHALAGDRAALLVVEGGGVVLEILDERAGLGAFEQHLGLAFVDLLASRHGDLRPEAAESALYSKAQRATASRDDVVPRRRRAADATAKRKRGFDVGSARSPAARSARSTPCRSRAR